MRNVNATCITETQESQIKFEENRRKIIFLNPSKLQYLKVKVDGCAIRDNSIRCDYLLVSNDEREERYVELKGTDVMHAIDQIEATIKRIGESTDNRHSYVICTGVAPHCTTRIQIKQILFRNKYKSKLLIKEKEFREKLY